MCSGLWLKVYCVLIYFQGTLPLSLLGLVHGITAIQTISIVAYKTAHVSYMTSETRAHTSKAFKATLLDCVLLYLWLMSCQIHSLY